MQTGPSAAHEQEAGDTPGTEKGEAKEEGKDGTVGYTDVSDANKRRNRSQRRREGSSHR